MEKLKFFSNGEYRESQTTVYYELHNPSTGEVTGMAPRCTEAEVKEAVEAAKAAYPSWSATPVAKRTQILYRVRELLMEHMEELTMLVARENGKTWSEAEGDVLKAKEGTELATQAPSLMMGDSLMDASSGFDTVQYREPMGVFAGIVPVNFPAMIPFGWMTRRGARCSTTTSWTAARRKMTLLIKPFSFTVAICKANTPETSCRRSSAKRWKLSSVCSVIASGGCCSSRPWNTM